MATVVKRHTYAWVTWICGLLAGEAHCQWSAWFRANNNYDKKRTDDGRLSAWTAAHAEMVRTRVNKLRALGWEVSVEDQNAFTVRGRTVDMGGKVDIVAWKDRTVRLEDCKTGRPFEKHFWQVVLYLLLLPKVDKRLEGFDPVGAVVYHDHVREVPMSEAVAEQALVYERIRALAGEEPRRVPSMAECRFCDIAACKDRVEAETSTEGTDTEDF